MKRFLLIFVPVLAIIAVLMFAPSRLDSALDIEAESASPLLNQLGFVCELQDSERHKFYEKDNQIVGECVFLDLSVKDLDRICNKLGLYVTDKYVADENIIVEGVSARLGYYCKDRQANVQIAVSERGMTIGSPIIYGSY